MALAQRGIDPRAADELELFEIACIFGHHRPPEEKDGDGNEGAEAAVEEFDPIAYRVAVAAAEKRGEPPPPLPAAARKALVRRPEAATSVARPAGRRS